MSYSTGRGGGAPAPGAPGPGGGHSIGGRRGEVTLIDGNNGNPSSEVDVAEEVSAAATAVGVIGEVTVATSIIRQEIIHLICVRGLFWCQRINRRVEIRPNFVLSAPVRAGLDWGFKFF